MRPPASLFAKILFWFFLNMVLVAVVLVVFFIFQQNMNLQALLGRQGADRFRATGFLIAHDLGQAQQTEWADVLASHAAVHRIDFSVLLQDGSYYSSSVESLPAMVGVKARAVLRKRLPRYQ